MYKGDIPPSEAHERLKTNPSAVLIDVRTQPEWAFVGVPAVERLVRLSWQVYPQMQVNADFVAEVEKAGIAKDSEILCICRSGARSASAARHFTKAGYSNAWNVAEGFEGDKDGEGPPQPQRRLEGRRIALGAKLSMTKKNRKESQPGQLGRRHETCAGRAGPVAARRDVRSALSQFRFRL